MKTIKLILPIIFVLLLVSFVHGFGVGSPYWEENPLTMYPGEIKEVDFNLQNMVGTEDYDVVAEVKQGMEIAELKRDSYTVKYGTSDTLAPLEIRLPNNATGTYRVKVDFKTVKSGSGGGVAMGTGMNIAFDVIVSGTAPKKGNMIPTSLMFAMIALILILVISLVVLVKRRKKDN
jgi:hypothetical protein